MGEVGEMDRGGGECAREEAPGIEPERVARAFHEAYERLAPEHGYQTRRDSAVPWDEVPEANRSLMIAVAAEIAPLIGRRYAVAGAAAELERLAHSIQGVTTTRVWLLGRARELWAECGREV